MGTCKTCGQPTKTKGARQCAPCHRKRGHTSGVDRMDFSERDCGYVTPCHVWSRAINADGYGVVRHYGKVEYAHIVSYETHRGSIPAGMTIDHLCRNRSCINPDHLEPVTHAENCRRGSRTRLNHAAVSVIRGWQGSVRDVAKMFGISASHASAIRTGKKWKGEPVGHS